MCIKETLQNGVYQYAGFVLYIHCKLTICFQIALLYFSSVYDMVSYVPLRAWLRFIRLSVLKPFIN
jgi:hypothetical protein